MPKFLHSLKFKIIVPVVVVLCFGMLLQTGIWIRGTVDQAEKSASENLYSSMRVANQNFESAMKEINRIVALASSTTTINASVQNYLRIMEDAEASSQEMIQYTREVDQYLFQLCSYKSYLNGMAVYDLQGHERSFGIIMNGQEILQQEWLTEFLEGEEDSIILPVHSSLPEDKNYDELVFSVVRKVKRGKAITGLVMADAHYQMLTDFYSFQDVSGYQIVIMDEDQEDILFPKNAEALEEKVEALRQLPDGQEGYYVENIDGTQYLLVDTQMPLTNWKITGFLEYRDLMADFYKTLTRVLIGTLVIAALVCGATTLVVVYATRKLTGLTKAVQDVDMERLELTFSLNGKDEVGLLYRQILKLLERIRLLISQMKQIEEEKREMEIFALQEQINPHFLYNTLNIISMLAAFRGMKNIQDVTGALSDMMHLTLDPAKYITVDEEIHYVESYLEIMEYKYSGKFTTEIDVEEGTRDIVIPKMILQPIVENSLQHGIASLTRPGKIEITVKQEGQGVCFIVRDNGKGMDEVIREILNEIPVTHEKREKHIGVRNVRDRLYLLYGKDCHFRIDSEEDVFTEVTIVIPVK